MDIRNYSRKHRVTLGMKSAEAGRAMEEWLHRAAPFDMHVRRAKTAGLICLIVELVPEKDASALYWLSWCIKNYDCKVDIKEL